MESPRVTSPWVRPSGQVKQQARMVMISAQAYVQSSDMKLRAPLWRSMPAFQMVRSRGQIHSLMCDWDSIFLPSFKWFWEWIFLRLTRRRVWECVSFIRSILSRCVETGPQRLCFTVDPLNYSKRVRSPLENPRNGFAIPFSKAITLNSSPISAGLVSFCNCAASGR